MSTTLTTCLWFDTEGQEAAEFYTSIFPNSQITAIQRYNEAGPREAGSVMVVAFELDGHAFVALNGGPQFSFNEATSIQIDCDSQEQIDHYWERLLEGGGEESMCGWLRDRYGFSWQIVPTRLKELLTTSDPETGARVMSKMFEMRKLDIAALEGAAAAPATR